MIKFVNFTDHLTSAGSLLLAGLPLIAIAALAH